MKLSFPFATLALPLSLGAQLRLTEVMSDSAHPGGATNGDWLEITNTGENPVNIGGYSFDDSTPIPGRIGQIFPSYLIPAGGSVIVLREDTSTEFRSTWAIDPSVRIFTTAPTELPNFPGLGSGGDSIFLFNASNTLVDQFEFGSSTTGVSFARFTDGSPVPGNLSVNGLFNAYQSTQASQDIGSPGIAPAPPQPLSPLFLAPFSTTWVINNSLANSFFRVNAVDPNQGDLISLSADNLPTWLTFNDLGNGVGQFSGVATQEHLGSHEITISALDNSGLTSPTTQVITVTIAPAVSPIILNEFNGVGSNEFLGGGTQDEIGGASDLILGREEGHGGDWIEFVVTGDAESSFVDLRNWTIKIEGNDKVRILKLSNHQALSSIANGTILTLIDDRSFADTALPKTSNLTTSGFLWMNLWMHDAIMIDQEQSIHPGGRTIGSSDTMVSVLDSNNQLIYGPIGESILGRDSTLNGLPDDLISVSETETLRLEGTPSRTVSPISVNYDDGSTSTFGAPNQWGTPELTQSFTAFIKSQSPPFFTSSPSRDALRGEYAVNVGVSSPGGLPLSFEAIALPSFLTMSPSAGGISISTNRELTTEDIGKYEITIAADNGANENNLGYLVYELTVHHPSPSVILNEYNAVASDEYLNGGTLALGENGGIASTDSHFGRVIGNGGNWFELVVVGDGSAGYSNLTGWSVEIGEGKSGGIFAPISTIALTDPSVWSTIANGTILTFIDKPTTQGGLDTALNLVDQLDTLGYAWSNFYLGNPQHLSVTNFAGFKTNSNNTQILIKDSSGKIVFGPAGEGVAPLSGIGNTEIFELENDPSPLVSSIDDSSATSAGYDDGSSGSTFGAPNLFEPVGGPLGDRAQDFTSYRLTAFQLYLANLGLSGAQPTQDSDHDGYSNISEYLFGGDPNNSQITPYNAYDVATGTLSVDLRNNDPAFIFTAQQSADLENWSSGEITSETSVSPLGDEFLRMTITPTNTGQKLFLRVAASPAP